ncbi:MAG: hypothetical protein ABI574_00925 [Burkholderiales bacterium]
MKAADLLPRLLVSVPGCPDVTAVLALVDAAIDFCRETNAWNEFQDPITLIDKVGAYDLEAPSDARPLAILGAWVSGRELVPKTTAQLNLVMPDWQTALGSEPVFFNSGTSNQSVRVFPIPMGARKAKLTLRVSYTPTMAATTLPDELVADHHEALISGALARLASTPGRAWSNPGLAGYHQGMFDTKKIDARINLFHDNTPGTVTVTPRRFG